MFGLGRPGSPWLPPGSSWLPLAPPGSLLAHPGFLSQEEPGGMRLAEAWSAFGGLSVWGHGLGRGGSCIHLFFMVSHTGRQSACKVLGYRRFGGLCVFLENLNSPRRCLEIQICKHPRVFASRSNASLKDYNRHDPRCGAPPPTHLQCAAVPCLALKCLALPCLTVQCLTLYFILYHIKNIRQHGSILYYIESYHIIM